jgi:4-amino-4-deoxy-L-arabinose transferase-like glycosyltransferase
LFLSFTAHSNANQQAMRQFKFGLNGEILKWCTSEYATAGNQVNSLRAYIKEHYQLSGVLLGALLVALSTGTYTNWDAQLEFEAASNVVTRGFPIVTNGLMINQPPLGFYLAAPVFHMFGLTYANGVAAATVFGLACVVLVYVLGTLLYDKRTGLVAAALFGIVPWHVYMSKIFLIDNQNLFLSLLFLAIGVVAIRRNSSKLLAVSGFVFGLAFLTKLFAVFLLVPLVLLILLQRKEISFKVTPSNILIFLVPALALQAVWFGGVANQNFFGVYFSSDITHPVLVANPSPFFLPIVLVNSAGHFLFAAGLFSMALTVLYRRVLASLLRLDAVCFGTVAVVAGLDLLLVFGLHLTVPYVSVFKYNYVALPFYCFLAASLATKGSLLLKSVDWKNKVSLLKPALVLAGVILLLACVLESTFFLARWVGFVAFGVDSVTYYPFDVYSVAANGFAPALTYLAAVLMVLTVAGPLLATALKGALGWFSKVLSS